MTLTKLSCGALSRSEVAQSIFLTILNITEME